jgi:hypothetical protein
MNLVGWFGRWLDNGVFARFAHERLCAEFISIMVADCEKQKMSDGESPKLVFYPCRKAPLSKPPYAPPEFIKATDEIFRLCQNLERRLEREGRLDTHIFPDILKPLQERIASLPRCSIVRHAPPNSQRADTNTALFSGTVISYRYTFPELEGLRLISIQ